MSRRKPPPPEPQPRRRVVRTAIVVTLVLATTGLLFYGLSQLDDLAKRNIGNRERYEVPVADLLCNTPPGTDRQTFLAEVRYVGHLPETVNVMAADFRGELATAFSQHPWVEHVETIEVDVPKTIRVQLKFRTPVLVVPTEGGGRKLVDGKGILMPANASADGVAEMIPAVPPPEISAGQVWENEVVLRAVELVNVYRPRRLEKLPMGWRLTQPDGKLLVVGL